MTRAGRPGGKGETGPSDWIERLVAAGLGLRTRLAGSDAPELVAIGWGTVELDRAARDLHGQRGAGSPGPPWEEAALGARARTLALGETGIQLLLLEPIREGPLAAFLARHGEGIAAVFARSGPAVAPEPPALDRGSARPGPARRVAGGRDGPFLVLVDPAWSP